MAVVTIPKNLIKEKDLILISRKEYEELLCLANVKAKRGYTQIDKDLDKAITKYKTGKFFGPFASIKEFKNSLEK